MQQTIRNIEGGGCAWRFEAMIDVVLHKDLTVVQDDIFLEYFRLHILQGIADWETILEQ